MSTNSIGGNKNFKNVQNTETNQFHIQAGVDALNLDNKSFVLATGMAAGDLTAAQLQTSASAGLGLRLTGAGQFNLIDSADTNANAKLIQSTLDLESVGQSRVLNFFFAETPGVATLQAAAGVGGGTNIVVSSFGATQSNALSTAGTVHHWVESTSSCFSY